VDLKGSTHFNKIKKKLYPTPHVHEKNVIGGLEMQI